MIAKLYGICYKPMYKEEIEKLLSNKMTWLKKAKKQAKGTENKIRIY